MQPHEPGPLVYSSLKRNMEIKLWDKKKGSPVKNLLDYLVVLLFLAVILRLLS